MRSVPGATGAQASSLTITRRRDNAATGTVALQSYAVATAAGTDFTPALPLHEIKTLREFESGTLPYILKLLSQLNRKYSTEIVEIQQRR